MKEMFFTVSDYLLLYIILSAVFFGGAGEEIQMDYELLFPIKFRLESI